PPPPPPPPREAGQAQVLAEAWRTGRRVALATVVHVTGSAYRREGASLLIHEDGRTEGTISGGCLEADVAEVAREVLRTGRPRLLHYDMTADDEHVWGLGLGCNGTVDVWVEPAVPENWPSEAAVVAVVTASQRPAVAPGRRLHVTADGGVVGSLGDPLLDAAVAAEAASLRSAGRSGTRRYGQGEEEVAVYFEVRRQPDRLVVFGAGHDAIPVVDLAARVGFAVTVVDPRPAFATAERFPSAAGVLCAAASELEGRLRLDGAYVCVMTHNFRHDLDYLAFAWGQAPRYLGLLGPRARAERLLRELAARGVPVEGEGRAVLHAPIGLDLGGETPEAVALAIVAELQLVRSGRSGRPLRERRGPIHDRTV
ncbi:MAG: XdhC family protein, partial [Clostridia bacterium]|nr:XdhC family protein [Clostridia bacterium]